MKFVINHCISTYKISQILKKLLNIAGNLLRFRENQQIQDKSSTQRGLPMKTWPGMTGPRQSSAFTCQIHKQKLPT